MLRCASQIWYEKNVTFVSVTFSQKIHKFNMFWGKKENKTNSL